MSESYDNYYNLQSYEDGETTKHNKTNKIIVLLDSFLNEHEVCCHLWQVL